MIKNVALWLFLAGNAVVVAVGIYWWTMPAPNLYLRNEQWRGPDRVPTMTFRAGTTAYLSRTACIDRSVQAAQGRRLVSMDGQVSAPLMPGFSKIDVGCVDYTIGVPIPPTFPAGRYKYVANVQMTVNPLRTVTTALESSPITVIQ